MAWKGTFFGALVGLLITRSALGALIGAFIGLLLDQSIGQGRGAFGGGHGASISQVFFRTTFELMGHVAKSDGRVSEAEIDAARRLMQELRLGPDEVAAAINCFRAGKSPSYDAAFGVEQLREACGLRHDLLAAFIELQLRAALAGNGISAPARQILMRAAERLGMSRLEFARMEAAVRARHAGQSRFAAGQAPQRPLAECYADLEVSAQASDAEVIKAYRRQMSRHHPDKLVANGLPESMAQWAKEKTQRIQESYEAIRAARGMH
ncbi:MAG TPA: co-chaperone DjlA [Steroidobacteraceae bacterium]|nr:co-chaperone DjlA [Steroidobacteraceae bacterium]